VCQPAFIARRRAGPAAVTALTVAGFESQKLSEPRPPFASVNAGGSFS
jgi:hypothetical protein